MFSDSRTSAPGEQKGFKPHTPHFIPWLRNSLKPQHSGDLRFNGPYKSNAEARNSVMERAKGIGLFSIQGRGRAKKAELRCNGVGMGRMLPVVLRGHHMLPGSLGKQREDSPPAEMGPGPNLQSSQAEGPQGPVGSSTSALDKHSFDRNSRLSLLQSKRVVAGTTARTPLAPAPALFPEEPPCRLPVMVCVEDGRGKVWDCSSHTSHGQRAHHSSSWLSSDSRGLTERQQGFSSSSNYTKQRSRHSESHRDLTALREPPVEGFSGSLNGVIVAIEESQRGLDYTKTLRGPRKPRPSSERIAVLGQNQSWVQHRPRSEGESQRRKEAGCSMKVVRKQIKCVVDNLEQVLTALRDVQQEMKEVVRQIDYLTSTIDLNDEEQWVPPAHDGIKPPSDSGSSSDSSCSQVTVGSAVAVELPPNVDSSATTRRSAHGVQLCPTSSAFASQRSRALQFTCRLGSRLGGPCSDSVRNLTPQDCSLSAPRIPPVRPPTPGLSPLTVNLHPPGSPGSQSHSPAASPSIGVSPASSPSRLSAKPHPLSPSVIIETKAGFYQTPQSDHPSAGPLSPSPAPSASCPPADSETQTAGAAVRERAAAVSAAKSPATQGRRGRRPPPYPSHGLPEQPRKVKEPRKAPPYPEKRRLLSTTV